MTALTSENNPLEWRERSNCIYRRTRMCLVSKCFTTPGVNTSSRSQNFRSRSSLMGVMRDYNRFSRRNIGIACQNPSKFRLECSGRSWGATPPVTEQHGNKDFHSKEKMRNQGMSDKWFQLRSNETGPHLWSLDPGGCVVQILKLATDWRGDVVVMPVTPEMCRERGKFSDERCRRGTVEESSSIDNRPIRGLHLDVACQGVRSNLHNSIRWDNNGSEGESVFLHMKQGVMTDVAFV